jgi:omega-amidase
MKLALIQMAPLWERLEDNHARAEAMLWQAADAATDVAVLPEMFSTGFSFSLDGLAPANEHPTHLFLKDMSRSLSMNIIAGFKALSPDGPERGLNLGRAYTRDGDVTATYAKMHPFTFSNEHEVIEPGPGPVVFDLEGIPSSMFICYDLRFPEGFRAVARRALAVYVLANWPASRQTHWEALLRARAIENQCFVIGVNRTGADANDIEYEGGSLVFGPQGEIFVRGGTAEELLLCNIDPHEVHEVRARFPFLDDMKLQ